MKIWVLSTCIPEDSKPCWPLIFTSEVAAMAAFRDTMQSEWEHNGEHDDEDKLLPCPEDPFEANDQMAALSEGSGWGEYLLTSHEVET